MAFHKPIFVGEVASCTCEIIFSSKQSILVEVVVSSEDFSKGEKKVTNTGWLWYVPMVPDGENKPWKVTQVPPMSIPKEEPALKKYRRAQAKYERRKRVAQNNGEGTADAKETDAAFDAFKSQYAPPSDGRSPADSEQVLCQMVLPGDCGKGGVAFGGFVMKLMDNAAGCSAFRHCRTNVVTVAIADMDFVSWIRLGDLCTIKSKAVFASTKSLEIEVVASAASAILGGEDVIVARGLFTFVSLGSDGKVLPVPALRLENEEDMRNAFLGQQRYEAAKKARAEGK
ncbi:hypothetical protein ACHAXT_005327 [Thalassiosira profunda]